MKKIIYLTILCWSLIAFDAFAQNNFLDFSGSADYVSLGDLGTVTDWTIETWFHYTALANYENLFSSDDGGGNANLIRLETSATFIGGALYIYMNNAGITIAPHGTISPGWHHIAIVGDKTNSKLYVYLDGVQKINQTRTSWPSTFHDFVLGRGFSSTLANRDWNGFLEDFRIWKVTRTEGEILAKKDVELTGNETGLYAYYQFNQGTCGGDNSSIPALTDLAALGGINNGTFNGFGTMNGCNSNFVCGGASTPCGYLESPMGNATAAVPTLGQWGLIILTLLLLTFGTITIRTRQTVLAGTHTSSRVSIQELPFDKSLFVKILLLVSMVVLTVFSIAIAMFRYELTSADIPGALVAVPLLAYLLHLLGGEERGA